MIQDYNMEELNIQMVDLKNQYRKIKDKIDNAIFNCIELSVFIKGPKVTEFQNNLAEYLNVSNVVSCGNGTDALQIAMMALELNPGDEVIVPAFSYAATAEVIGLLGLTPVMIDVDEKTFNINGELVKEAVTERTKLIVPVHLFGQAADMEGIMAVAFEHNLYVIEDTAQALGSESIFVNGDRKKLGTIGDIGCTSFFPSKNLGCFGDGGATFTNNEELARKLKTIANHGQQTQYIHEVIGINSRLDSIQAAILLEKLNYLSSYNEARLAVADFYDNAFSKIEQIEIPYRSKLSTHVFHQYTLKIKDGRRDELKDFLKLKNIPSMIYYPKPLHEQEAYKKIGREIGGLNVAKTLCKEVLSLPIHTEMTSYQLDYIAEQIKTFFNE